MIDITARLRSACRGVLCALGLSAFVAGGCVTNPATGTRQFNVYDREQEIQIGQQAAEEAIQAYGGLVPDESLRAYVSQIGHSLARHTEADYPSLPWEFYFLNADVVNAFAVPGGKIFVCRGLVEKMTNEAQLAGVLGHEIAHVTAEHIDKRIGEQMAIQLGAVVLAEVLAGGGSTAAQAAQQAIFTGSGLFALRFSREDELTADALGVRYMVREGYNPLGQVQTMEILLDVAQASPRQIEIFSTHPAPKTRIARLKELIEEEYPETLSNPRYKLQADRFQMQFMPRLKALPPGPGPEELGLYMEAVEEGLASLGDPAGWCGVCRAHHEAERPAD